MPAGHGALAVANNSDIIPVGEFRTYLVRAGDVICCEIRQSFIRQHHTPTERVVSPIPLKDHDFMRRISQFPYVPKDTGPVRTTGTVLTRVTIARDGRLLDVAIERSSGLPSLDSGVIEKLPSLKLIATRSTCFDHIDTDYCTAPSTRERPPPASSRRRSRTSVPISPVPRGERCRRPPARRLGTRVRR